MKAGNVNYIKLDDLPVTLAVFPLQSVLILPGGYLTLNVFEPRYLELVDDAMKTNRLLGIIQMLPHQEQLERPQLYNVGCIARIISYTELGDGRLAIAMQGICRFSLGHECATSFAYRIFAVDPFIDDLKEHSIDDEMCREKLLDAFSDYLEANELEADWESMIQASTETLVNALAISAPFTTAEKQALLEAPTLNERVDILIALAERSILAQDGVKATDLQ